MATKSTKQSGVLFQPSFDPRNLPTLYGGAKMQRGQMWLDGSNLPSQTSNNGEISDASTSEAIQGIQWGFQFLYNPSTISLSFGLNTSIYPPGTDDGGGSGTNSSTNDDTPILGGGSSATLSFDLIVDRTYECWGGPPSAATAIMRNGLNVDKKRGILVDFEHFNAMMGYTDDSPFAQPNPLFVSFGNKLGNFYYGYINSYSFGVTNWTQYMIPNRGAISGVSMSILPLSNTLKTRGGSATQGYQYGSARTTGTNFADTPDQTAATQAAANPGAGAVPAGGGGGRAEVE
jgi:hypothetical protein